MSTCGRAVVYVVIGLLLLSSSSAVGERVETLIPQARRVVMDDFFDSVDPNVPKGRQGKCTC